MTEQERTLTGCVKGDKSSWDAFVRQYSALVYHTINKTLSLHHAEKDPDLVDDLFQEIFLTLVKDDYLQLRRFRGDDGCTLASWLRLIAARRTIDQLRKLKEPVSSVEDLHVIDPSGDSDECVKDEQIQVVAGAIAKLHPRERLLIDFFFRQNLSAENVASILHLSVAAVYTQKSRILAKLRETLQKPSPL